MLEINFTVMRSGLRLLRAAKALYQSIALVLQQLNSISYSEYVKTFLFILIELKIRLIIENDLKRKKLCKRMSGVIVYILC